MKLLSPVQNQDRKAQELARDVLRVQEMNKAADKARKNLANAEADFAEVLAKHKKIWSAEEKEHQDTLKLQRQEVEELEQRKAQALIPVKLYEDQVKAKEAVVDQALEDAKQAQARADDLSERLEDKLDQVGQREQNLITREQKVASRETGVELQAEQVRQGARKLSDDIAAFQGEKATAEADINERKTALFLWEQSLVAKEEKQKRTDQALLEKEIKLADDEKRLARSFARAEKPLSS